MSLRAILSAMPLRQGVKEPLKSRLSLAKLRTTLPGRGFTREAIYSYSGLDATLKGTHSNIIFSGDSMFVADANHLYCLDKELKTRWMADLPAVVALFLPLRFSVMRYVCRITVWPFRIRSLVDVVIPLAQVSTERQEGGLRWL